MKKVFISYPREDADLARRLFNELRAIQHIDPWLDEQCLLPGLEWDPAIRKEIRDADYFLALLSCNSTEGEGYQHVELDQALERLARFPKNQVFLIPARLDECKMPRYELDKLHRVDLFPDWTHGMERLLSVLAPNAPLGNSQDSKIRPMPGYHYRVGLVDLDLGLPNLRTLAESLNQTQGFFLFNYPEMASVGYAVGMIGGLTNLKVFEIRSSFFTQLPNLPLDLVVCLTKHPLAFEEDNEIIYNYFAGESAEDERFLFISTDQLYGLCKKADRTFEEGLVHLIVGQLMNYFTKIGYHPETRGCVMDHCKLRADQLHGLKSRKFCKACDQSLPKGELRHAIEAMLSWN
jgi:hypothetical protein